MHQSKSIGEAREGSSSDGEAQDPSPKGQAHPKEGPNFSEHKRAGIGRGPLNRDDGNLGFCHIHIPQIEDIGVVFFPLSKKEGGNTSSKSHGQPKMVQPNLGGCASGDEQQRERKSIATMVKDFSHGRRAAGSSGLFAVQGVHSLVKPNTESSEGIDPTGGFSFEVGAVKGEDGVLGNDGTETDESDEVGSVC